VIVDRLILHHTYQGATAFDVSQNHNHGTLEDVTLGGGAAHFSGGPGRVRVPASATLASMRAVRTTVRFNWQPTGPVRRYNLIEGYLSFALVINPDASVEGTILDRGGTWGGAQSAPGLVTAGQWHEATFVHDGISACRVDLDGVPVAEAFDILGPAQGVQAAYGLAIGHWPDPDDRYSFIGDIDDIRVWMDRPEAVKDYAETCCCDHGELIDQAFTDVRAKGFHALAYRNAAEALYDLGSKVFGQMASGTEADRVHALDLARQFALSVKRGDRAGLMSALDTAGHLVQSKVPAAELAADGNALVAALHPTLLGPVVESALKGGANATPAHLEKLMERLGIDQWAKGFCFDWVTPPPGGKDTGRGKPQQHPDNGTDPTTDHGAGDPPPSWGATPGQYDDGDNSGGDPNADGPGQDRQPGQHDDRSPA